MVRFQMKKVSRLYQAVYGQRFCLENDTWGVWDLHECCFRALYSEETAAIEATQYYNRQFANEPAYA